LQVYDISNNQITGTAFMGTVGLNWQFSGVGNFSGAGESDMLLRNANTGGLQVYDITNNQLTGSAFLGAVGLDWQFSGVGNFSGVAGETDLLLRNVNTGGLQVYDITNNQLTGSAFLATVGLDWQFAGVARSAAPARPISFCATSPPAHSRPIASPTIKSPVPPAWGRWDWSGRSAASPPIPRPHQPRSSCRPWPVSAAAVATARPTDRTLRRSMPTHRSRRF
jgi:hypothetical protein